jgi:hypothetical protein
LGKRIRNPACDHHNYIDHHHDNYDHNNSRSDYNNGHANNCPKYYVPNDDSANNNCANDDPTNIACPWLT